MERTVFAEVLAVEPALHGVISKVVSVRGEEQITIGVEGQTEQIASTFAEQLESFREGMEPPDGLLELDTTDKVARRASGHAVEPAVQAPGEMVRHRLGILHAEAREKHYGVGVGHVVA